MAKKILEIRIGSREQLLRQFKFAWENADSLSEQKGEVIYFEDTQTLLKVLTPKRFSLLEYLHGHGRLSIRALSKQLHRDYKNVHQDVTLLNQSGLVSKDKDNKFFIAWDDLVTHISFA